MSPPSNILSDELDLDNRMRRAAIMTKLAELDIFEQVLRQASDDALSLSGMTQLSAEDRMQLGPARAKLQQGAPLTAEEAETVKRAGRQSEQLGRALRRKTLRTTQASSVQLLTLMAHSPIYKQEDRLRALKQLEDMRAANPGLSAGEVDELLKLPLANAFARIGELMLSGEIPVEQVERIRRILIDRTHAENLDLKAKYGEGRMIEGGGNAQPEAATA